MPSAETMPRITDGFPCEDMFSNRYAQRREKKKNLRRPFARQYLELICQTKYDRFWGQFLLSDRFDPKDHAAVGILPRFFLALTDSASVQLKRLIVTPLIVAIFQFS
jgi:hypothetical protein